VLQVGRDVEAHPVHRDPVPNAHADAGNLGIADEYTDLLAVPFTRYAESVEGGDHPVFECLHEGSHVTVAPRQVEHDVSDSLARAVIGEAAAAARLEHGKAVGRD